MSDKIRVTKSSLPPYEEYIEAIKPLWDSHWITNMGKYHQMLEQKLTKYLEVDNLSLMVNGHMALEMVIQAMNFPKGSEIITTPFTFISTTHAIVRNDLIPVFCDVKLTDGTIDETKIADLITERTVAIVPVHVYGNICNVEEIQRIADNYGLKVIYDAAHAFGIKYNGKGIGNYGDASIFSFHATKIFNTIEGGAVTFKDKYLYKKLYNLKNFGIQGENLVTEIGANAKMNEFSAIMGLCNLNHIEQTIMNRKDRYQYYELRLRENRNIRKFTPSVSENKNYAYFPILIKNNRDKIYSILKENEIYTRKYFYPITADQLCFKNKYKQIDLTVARKLSEEILILPLYEDLSFEDIDRICLIIEKV